LILHQLIDLHPHLLQQTQLLHRGFYLSLQKILASFEQVWQAKQAFKLVEVEESASRVAKLVGLLFES